jgi:hypothetical protein
MPTLSLDLSYIKAQAKKNEPENHAFAKFLRQFPSSMLDALVASLCDDIEPKIDCKACANCCKNLYAAALEHELPALAQVKSVSVETFKEHSSSRIKTPTISRPNLVRCFTKICVVPTMCVLSVVEPFQISKASISSIDSTW